MISNSIFVRTISFLLFPAFLLLSGEVLADKICTDDVVRVKKRKVRVTNALRLQTGDCPKGFTELVDTDEFTGAQGPAGSDGSDGMNGSNGTNGTNGTNGSDGVSGHEIVDDDSASFTLTNGAVGAQTSNCPGSKVVSGGGCFTNSLAVTLVINGPETTSGTSWSCGFRNDSGSSINSLVITARAVCVTAN